MVDINHLYKKLDSLSDELKSEVEHFIDFLKSKSESKDSKKFPKFGSGKGMFIIKDDFDEPLDDFKEYTA
jgi:hypothetical protein